MSQPLVEEELSSIEAIYGNDVVSRLTDAEGIKVQLQLQNGAADPTPFPALLICRIPSDYPRDCPPIFTVEGPFSEDAVSAIVVQLSALFTPGEPVLFAAIEWLREHGSDYADHTMLRRRSPPPQPPSPPSHSSQISRPPPARREREEPTPAIASTMEIVHGEPLVDRHSKFVAHLARVKTIDDVERFRAILYTDKRVAEVFFLLIPAPHPFDPTRAQATHNVLAYRLSGPPPLEGRDDDGEGGAGDTMLYLMQKVCLSPLVHAATRTCGAGGGCRCCRNYHPLVWRDSSWSGPLQALPGLSYVVPPITFPPTAQLAESHQGSPFPRAWDVGHDGGP